MPSDELKGKAFIKLNIAKSILVVVSACLLVALGYYTLTQGVTTILMLLQLVFWNSYYQVYVSQTDKPPTSYYVLSTLGVIISCTIPMILFSDMQPSQIVGTIIGLVSASIAVAAVNTVLDTRKYPSPEEC